MKRKISTFAPVFSGFYDNWMWEPDFEYEAEYFEEQFAFIGELWKYHEWEKWKLQISKAFSNRLEPFLSDFVTKISYERTYSPKEYNFATDAIYCDITVKAKKIREYLYKNKEAFDKYLHDNYTGRDGFIPSYSNNFEDWEEETNGFKNLDHSHKCGAILQFICQNAEIEERDVYERCLDRSDLNVDYTEELWHKINHAETFIKDNYIKNDLLSLAFENIDPKEFDIEALITKIKKEIESHTIKLDLKFK